MFLVISENVSLELEEKFVPEEKGKIFALCTVERDRGIEPPSHPWEGCILPMY